MNEADWLACQNADTMLNFVLPQLSPRKQLLFSVACCRRHESLLTDESRQILVTLERSADMPLSFSDANELSSEALAHADDLSWHMGTPHGCALWLAANAVHEVSEGYAGSASLKIAEAIECAGKDPETFDVRKPGKPALADPKERIAQTVVLRCIVGNPFRHVRVDPSWLIRNDGEIVKLAQAIYDGRCFERLPRLARGLEDAGCIHEEVLEHLRSSEIHVRGCWVLDLLLDKH
jgi:hypothetical protein